MKRLLFSLILLVGMYNANAQSISLFSPNGGEQFAIGSTQSIAWASIGIAQIDIEFSSNNGTTYTTVANGISANLNSYAWLITSAASANARIRIKESGTGNYAAVSAAVFSVQNPFLSITYPTAGLLLNQASTVTIEWAGLIVGNTVTIDFSSDNGFTYTNIATNTPNYYSFDWLVPQIASTTCLIKIKDSNYPTVTNISPVFSIAALPASGAVLLPNGGEIMTSTSTQQIAWSVTGTSFIDLEYTFDGGTTWLPIAQNVPNLPANYDWVIPSTPSTMCKVRIINTATSVVIDQSNNWFTIFQPAPILYLSTPFGYEEWAVGSIKTLQWSQIYMNTLKIEFSSNGGASFSTIANNVPASNLTYQWTVPATITAQGIIKITDIGSGVSSQNQNAFSIVNPYVVLYTPNGGEIYNAGTDTLITWGGSLASSMVKIEYSIDNGVSWLLIQNNYPNSNYYEWTVPNNPSTNCKVKVSDAGNTSVFDVSSAVFTISPPVPEIQLTSPNGGENWWMNSTKDITWNSVNIANVKIEYTTNNGISWNVITAATPAATGTYSWLVAIAPSNSLKVRVSNAANPIYYDESDTTFSVIIGSGYLSLIYPNGFEQIAANLPVNIYWNAVSINQISLAFSINDGLTWQTIVNSIDASTGSYSWLVPAVYSNTCKIRVLDASNPTIGGQSAAFFSIIQPSISFTSFPSGGNYASFSPLSLQWVSIGIGNQAMKLEYSSDNGFTWVTFASNIANSGYYNWAVNCPPTNNCKVRISIQSQPSTAAVSPGSISVVSIGSSIYLTNPVAFTNYGTGTILPITWYSNNVNYVRIEYSINGDSIYQPISLLTPSSSGVYNWQIPTNLVANNCKIKVSNAGNTAIFSENSGFFNIQNGQINMLSGITFGNYLSGNTFQILWNSTLTSNYVNIYYSIDTINWLPIAAYYSNTGNYAWSIPFINENTVWVKVEDANNTAIFDVSDAAIAIGFTTPLIELISPASTSVLLAGSNYTIEWNAQGMAQLNIEFSADNGTTWNTIATALNASAGTYLWSVPSISNNTCKLKLINAANNLEYYEQPLPFSIQPEFIQVSSPNGGEQFQTNSNNLISWQSLAVDFVNIYYSANAGSTWLAIDTNMANVGYYNWQTPALSGSQYRVKVASSLNDSLNDVSNSNFSINTTAPALNLVSPNGSEVVLVQSGCYITWLSSGLNTIDLFYSVDGGITYQAIATSITASPAYYYWYTPNTPSTTVKIKIASSANASLNDVSNANFTLQDNPSQLSLNFPNGGETFQSGSFQTIKWSAVNTPFVKIYVSTNGGVTYTYINAMLSDSSFLWQVPALNSANCKIKVENGNDAGINDFSTTVFAINNQPLSNNIIKIDTLSSNVICSQDTFNISFQTVGTFTANNTFKVQLSNAAGNFTSFTVIGEVQATSPVAIACAIPSFIAEGTAYKLRIVADKPATIGTNYAFGNLSVRKANADFTSSAEIVLLTNPTVNFNANAWQQSLTSSNWNVGNNGLYSTYAAQHTYIAMGKYDVSHTVIDTSGCAATKLMQRKIAVEQWFQNTTLTVPMLNDLVDISFENAQYGCAIYKNGNCLVSSDSGKTWSINYTPANQSYQLKSIATQTNAWYITTNSGAYLKSVNKGLTWIYNNVMSNSESLNDLQFLNSNLAYAVGHNGKIFRYNGTAWQNQNSTTNHHLNAIALNAQKPIAIGDSGTILKLTNNQWSSMNAPVNVNLNAVSFSDSLHGYIAGSYGFILKTGDAGATWAVALSGADVDFTSIASKNDTVWAVGNNGAVYMSKNSGTSWQRYNVGSNNNLGAIYYQYNKGFIVGQNGLMRTFNTKAFVPQNIDAIEKVETENSFTCFPNPTQSDLFIQYSAAASTTFDIHISNITGKQVKTIFAAQFMQGKQLVVPMSELEAGIYFVSLSNSTHIETFKVVKTK